MTAPCTQVSVSRTRDEVLADIRHAVANMRDTEYAARAPGDVIFLLSVVDDLQTAIVRMVLDAALAPAGFESRS